MTKKPLEQYSLQKEEEIRKFWVKGKIAEKARKMNKKGKGFFMMDGPPYASGHIHMGTAMNKITKDIAIRMKRMQGFDVRDQPGYDTHGLPIENKVEGKLGFKNKKDIEKYGVDKFVNECRDFATEFIDVMNGEFDNLGVWMDWEKPYLTLDNKYIEAIWWTFKKADEKKLLYLGKYSVHVCPRCETAVAYNEIEYVKQTDTSVYVKFKVKGEGNKYLLIWTTTPWTLPGNTGVMVHPKYDYAEVAMSNGEVWIIANDLVQKLMDSIEAGYNIKRTIKGKELEGMEYENPLAKNLKLSNVENGYRVILSERYVNLDEGTGLVHTAPGHGKEDYDAGSKAGLPIVSPVALNGEMTEEAGKYQGKKARVVDAEIIEDLENDGALVYKHPYTHDYPVCWRCKSSLLMIATPQWFFKVTDIQKRMIELNEEVYWVPSWGKDRFRNWLESLGDWPVSRARYWGTPLPIWTCDSCEERVVVGSVKELGKFAKIPKNLELHKPWIDEIKWDCKCGGDMTRVSEVLDVWFDSGATSWGSLEYPENKELFKKFWPADLNIEGKDQIRGWWNSQLITSTICFDDKPFKAIAMHGMVLDLSKTKMSKSQGNIVGPQEVIDKYNRDYLRFYIASEVKGEDVAFNWDSFRDIHRFFNIFWNTYNFINMYLEIDPKSKFDKKALEVEDKWLLSKLNSLVNQVSEEYNKYNFPKVVHLVEYFVMEELSRTYIKLIRARIGGKTEKGVKGTLNLAIPTLLKLLAPVAPHMTEYIYQDFKGKGMEESIHLSSLPKADKKLIDEKLEKEMQLAKELAEKTLSLRGEQKLRLRWPLEELVVQTKSGKELSKILKVLAKMCNVKKVKESTEQPKGNYAKKDFDENIVLHLNIDASDELKEVWELMELRRRIQDLRKQAKLMPSQKVKLHIDSSDKDFLKKYGKEIAESTNTSLVEKKGNLEKLLEKEFFIELEK